MDKLIGFIITSFILAVLLFTVGTIKKINSGVITKVVVQINR